MTRLRIATLAGASVALCAGATVAVTAAGAGGQKPIRIGTSISETGVYAAVGQYALRGYRLYVDLLNKRGGLLGRPVQLVVYDDQSSPATAVRLYNKLISDDRVDVIVGPYSSVITQAVASVAEKFRRPMLDPFAAATSIFVNTQWNFQAITPSERYLASIADIAKIRGYKTMALLINNTSSTTSMAAALRARAEAFGIKVVYQQTYPTDTSDFSSMVLAAKAADPDVVVGTTYVPDSVGITRELNRQGLHPKLLAFSIGVVEPEFQKALGPLANRVLGNTLWWPSLKRPGNAEFVAAYRAKYHQEPVYQAAMGYGAMQVLERAVTQIGSLDQSKLRDTIAAMRLRTVAGPFQLGPDGRQVGDKSYVMQWQGGKAKLVWPPKVAEAPLQLPYR